MAELTFLSSLNDEQAAYAHQILDKAKEMGIPPQLALGIAMNESKFKPNVPDSSAGAIGLMQVIPETGKNLGYSEKQLRNPETNIEAGLKALKQNLDRTNGNWMLSAALYNAGDRNLLNANVEKNGFPEETKSYLQNLKSYGVFNTGPPKAEGEAEPAAGAVTTPSMLIPPFASSGAPAASAAAPEEDEEAAMMRRAEAAKPDQKILADVSARSAARNLGGLTGAGISAGLLAKNVGPTVIQAGSEAMERGRIAAQAKEAQRVAAAAQAAGSAGAAGNAGPLSAAGVRPGPPESVIADAGYLAKGETGVQVYNTAKGLGFTDVQAADFVKKGMTAKDVYAEAQNTRSAGFKKTRDLFPYSSNWVENPQHAGLSLPEEPIGGGSGPRASFKIVPGAAGQPTTLQALPVSAPISTAPPKPGGLDYVRDLFKGLMDSKLARGAGTVMKYAAPPLALAGAASEGQNFYQQLQKPEDQRDYGDMALSGLGALSGVASLIPFPPVALPAAAIATGIGGYRLKQDYDAANRARARLAGSSMR